VVRVRCTQRVLERLRIEPSTEVSPSTTKLGDWYANLLNVGHRRWALCLGERSLLPALLPARKEHFPGGLANAVDELLPALGVIPAAVRDELGQMQTIAVDRTRSRPVLGVMNDFSLSAELGLRDGHSPTEVALRGAETPVKPLDYDCPRRLVRELVGAGRGGTFEVENRASGHTRTGRAIARSGTVRVSRVCPGPSGWL